MCCLLLADLSPMLMWDPLSRQLRWMSFARSWKISNRSCLCTQSTEQSLQTMCGCSASSSGSSCLPGQREPWPAFCLWSFPPLRPLPGPPSLQTLPSRLFQIVWDDLGSCWPARMNEGLRHGGMNTFSHIYNRRGSPWQAASHRPTSLS